MLNPQNRFRLESSLFLILGCLFVALAHHNNWLIALDRVVYDFTIANTSAPMQDDLVIVAIDDHSLHELGPWPWPRDLQAELLRRISNYDPKLIAVDIVYAGETEHDAALVSAVESINTFAAPIIIDTTLQGGQHIEVLPFPELAEQVDILGHVQIEFDDDAIVRGTHLYQGVGQPVWSHLMIGVVEALGYNTTQPCTNGNSPNRNSSPLFISKCNYVRIPFAGPPSTYPQVSAHLLLQPDSDNQLLKQALENKIVLVGAMAFGVGDWITSPLGDEVTPLSGVEFNANLLSAITHGTTIKSAPTWINLSLACLLIALLCLALPRLRPRQSILTIVVIVLLPIALTALLLNLFWIHLPLASVTVAALVIYPLWSWRRHEVAWTFIESELDRIDHEGQRLTGFSTQSISIKSIAKLLDANVSGQAGSLIVQREKPLSAIEEAFLNSAVQEPNPDASEDALPGERLAAQIGRLQKRARIVREGREIGLSALDHMSSGALIVSATGQIVFTNDEAERLLSIKEHAEVLESLDSVQPPLGQNWLEIWRTVVLRHESVIFESSARNTPVFVTARPLLDPESDPEVLFAPYWVLTISDLTEIRHAQAQREEALAFLSHDLRSPLSSVLALIEQHGGQDSDGILERVKSYTQKGLSASDQFLQLSRLQLHSEIEFYLIELDQICQNAADQMFFLAKEKNISIQIDQPLEELWVQANGELLERALVNLLSNAVKYSPEHTEISVSFEANDEWAITRVSDQGFGIPSDELPHIFEPYFRSRAQELVQNRGAGLGLRFVKTVIDRHAGNISVRSTVGQGTTFELVLRREDQDSMTATT